ncbi:hypothetical protein GCM10010275_69700 [Streptomyces litmocidini]|nr:hypothetical protein GCM10010275_69700 [Streptomyces litmocidini]
MEPEPASSEAVLGSTDDWVMGPTPKVQRGTRIRLRSSDGEAAGFGIFRWLHDPGDGPRRTGDAVKRGYCGDAGTAVMRVSREGVLRAVRAVEV